MIEIEPADTSEVTSILSAVRPETIRVCERHGLLNPLRQRGRQAVVHHMGHEEVPVHSGIAREWVERHVHIELSGPLLLLE